ncbi:MAG: alpha/beta hydrolase [bacterium]|nr:alpha/beta hydrolase [bacterium]
MPTLARTDAVLHYEIDGAGDAVVLLGGFSQHSHDRVMTVLRGLFARQYRVICVDHRGAGQTTITPHTRASADIMADDIAAVLDHEGIEAAHTLGISMGGIVSNMLALRHPARLRSQVIAVSLAYVPPHNRTNFMLETLRLLRDQGVPLDLINRVGAGMLFGESVFEQEAYIQAVIHAPADPHVQTRQGFDLLMDGLKTLDLRPHLAAIRTPTLVMSSPDDVLAPPHHQQALAAGIPGAAIRHYPGGHLFMALPSQIGPFVQDVSAFWNAH